ncbi:MAG: carbohydrate ABC transporter permease [Thermomicrobiales bacterium]
MQSRSIGAESERRNAKPRALALRQLWDKHLYPYALLAPTILVMLALVLYPVGSAINLSFRDVDIVRTDRSYGPFTLGNYRRLFRSDELWPALRVSLLYVLIVTIACYVIGLWTAWLLNHHFRGRRLARLLITIPWAIPLVVATNIFWWLFDKTFGMFNYALTSSGIIDKPIDWFLNPRAAMAAVSITTIWKGYPFFTVMLLAALQAIPTELYDAAKVDGASAWREFRSITLPALRGVTAIVLLVNALWVFREFTVIFVLTGGGPAGATETLSIWTYLEAFGNFHMGFAAAIGVLTLLISIVAGVVFVRMSRSEFYG